VNINSGGIKLKAVIFDLDGTLVDSSEQIHACVNYSRIRKGFIEISHQRVKEILGLPAENLFLDLQISDKEIQDLILLFRARLAEFISIENKIFPGVIETLKLFKAAGFLIGIATSKPSALTHLVIENSLLKPYIDYFQGTDGFMPKPNPEVIFKTISGLSASESVMIGDRLEDILAANAAGIQSVGVAQSAHTEKQLLVAGASLVYPSMVELSRSIVEIKKLFVSSQ
jgi:phosphoglycolate phosphatase